VLGHNLVDFSQPALACHKCLGGPVFQDHVR
jgi:hypothetical protein